MKEPQAHREVKIPNTKSPHSIIQQVTPKQEQFGNEIWSKLKTHKYPRHGGLQFKVKSISHRGPSNNNYKTH